MKKIMVFLIVATLCFINIYALVGCKTSDSDKDDFEYRQLFDIDLTLENKSVYARVNIEYRSLISADNVILQYYPFAYESSVVDQETESLCYPNGVDYASTDIIKVSVNGENVSYSQDKIQNTIVLDRSVKRGENVSVFIEYRLTLPNAKHRLGYYKSFYALTDFYPYVASVIDGRYSIREYSPIGECERLSISDFNVTVRISDKFVLAHSGNTVSVDKENNYNVYTIQAVGVRDFALSYSSDFTMRKDSVDGIDVEYYFLKDSTPNDELGYMKKAIACYQCLFGKYPLKKFCLVIAPLSFAGMEYSGFALVNDSLKDSDRESVIVHEIAHQWWFMKVANDQGLEPWIDESLAEFSMCMYYLQTDRGRVFEQYRQRGLNTLQNRIIDKKSTDIIGSVYEFDQSSYYDCVYVLGSLMWINLYSVKGPWVIEKLQKYASDYEGKIASKSDLVDVIFADAKSIIDAWLSGSVIS